MTSSLLDRLLQRPVHHLAARDKCCVIHQNDEDGHVGECGHATSMYYRYRVVYESVNDYVTWRWLHFIYPCFRKSRVFSLCPDCSQGDSAFWQTCVQRIHDLNQQARREADLPAEIAIPDLCDMIRSYIPDGQPALLRCPD